MAAMESSLFLPDYLLEEAWSDQGGLRSDQVEEFTPAVLYMEQILRIFPREYTSRLKMIPAGEETLMKLDESKGGGADKKANA